MVGGGDQCRNDQGEPDEDGGCVGVLRATDAAQAHPAEPLVVVDAGLDEREAEVGGEAQGDRPGGDP